MQARAWIEVSVDAARANFLRIREAAGAAGVIPMVKADAYGLGAARVAGALESLEPRAYGVATAEEGEALRTLGVERPILVFTPIPHGSIEAAAQAKLICCASSLDTLDRWAAAAQRHGPLAFHVEIDTGMGRAGFDFRETGSWAHAVRARVGPQLTWSGAYTHFHSADANDGTATAAQWGRFRDAVAQLPVSSEDLLLHASNSAAALRWPEYAADAVRPGIFLYGGHPAPGVKDVPAPARVASVRARLVHVHDVPPGSTAGYGATHVARGWERWGTVAIGYGDGYPRALGNRGRVLVNGQRVRVVGRISMDLTVVDISGVAGAAAGDIVTLIGRDGDEEITVDEVATQAGTISYEILTGFTARLPRIGVA
jgi:alanine racemase